MINNIFLTGATGFLGRNLLQLILTQDEETKVTLLVRGNSLIEAENRISRILNSTLTKEIIENAKKRINTICGNVTSVNFGISDDIYSDLTKNTTHIIHAAAVVNFQLTIDKARETNCKGAKRIIAFAKDIQVNRNLKRVAFISTAYVCGDRFGNIL